MPGHAPQSRSAKPGRPLRHYSIPTMKCKEGGRLRSLDLQIPGVLYATILSPVQRVKRTDGRSMYIPPLHGPGQVPSNLPQVLSRSLVWYPGMFMDLLITGTPQNIFPVSAHKGIHIASSTFIDSRNTPRNPPRSGTAISSFHVNMVSPQRDTWRSPSFHWMICQRDDLVRAFSGHWVQEDPKS